MLLPQYFLLRCPRQHCPELCIRTLRYHHIDHLDIRDIEYRIHLSCSQERNSSTSIHRLERLQRRSSICRNRRRGHWIGICWSLQRRRLVFCCCRRREWLTLICVGGIQTRAVLNAGGDLVEAADEADGGKRQSKGPSKGKHVVCLCRRGGADEAFDGDELGLVM